MSSKEEVAAAIEAAKTNGLPICSNMTFDIASRSIMGVNTVDFASFAAAQGTNYIGANCGISDYADGAIHYHGTPELTAD